MYGLTNLGMSVLILDSNSILSTLDVYNKHSSMLLSLSTLSHYLRSLSRMAGLRY